MKYLGNIFESESYRGTGVPAFSDVTVVTIILSVVSALAGVLLIANFGEITAKIAICTANLLVSGIPMLITAVVVGYFGMRMKRRMRRNVWGW